MEKKVPQSPYNWNKYYAKVKRLAKKKKTDRDRYYAKAIENYQIFLEWLEDRFRDNDYLFMTYKVKRQQELLFRWEKMLGPIITEEEYEYEQRKGHD